MAAIDEKILQARDNRSMRQKEWLKRYSFSLVSYTLNIPGRQKQSNLYNRIHDVGLSEILLCIRAVAIEKYILSTGSEAIIATDMDAIVLKHIVINIEESHPLGRLFDIDVLDKNGQFVSRENLVMRPRQCFLCNEDARICARSRTHSINEILTRINEISENYFTI